MIIDDPLNHNLVLLEILLEAWQIQARKYICILCDK